MSDFRCVKCGAGLGQIVRNGRGSHLLVYRRAVDYGMPSPEPVEVLGQVSGRLELTCDACQAVNVWRANARTLVDLFKQLDTSAAVEFSVMLSKER